jgi:hypothetical protein
MRIEKTSAGDLLEAKPTSLFYPIPSLGIIVLPGTSYYVEITLLDFVRI